MSPVSFPLVPGRTVLLSMDFQRDIALPDGGAAPDDEAALERFAAAVDRAAEALEAARTGGTWVGHVRVILRLDEPAANRHSPMTRFLLDRELLREGSEGAEFVPALAPRPGEWVITKRMVSAFAGTDLDAALRNQGVDTLVLMGLVTHFVVEGTAREAADRGYRVVVLHDACASGAPERHTAALDICGRLGALVPTADWCAALDPAKSE